MDIDGNFEDLKRRFGADNELVAEFNKAEQQWMNNPGSGVTSTEVVRQAWERLGPGEQAKSMDILFNAFYHQLVAARKWLDLFDKEPDGNTYLRNGDLEIIDDTLAGALAMRTIGAEEQSSPDKIFPNGMLEIPTDVLQRLISEVELLQFRQKMRADKKIPDPLNNPE